MPKIPQESINDSVVLLATTLYEDIVGIDRWLRKASAPPEIEQQQLYVNSSEGGALCPYTRGYICCVSTDIVRTCRGLHSGAGGRLISLKSDLLRLTNNTPPGWTAVKVPSCAGQPGAFQNGVNRAIHRGPGYSTFDQHSTGQGNHLLSDSRAGIHRLHMYTHRQAH